MKLLYKSILLSALILVSLYLFISYDAVDDFYVIDHQVGGWVFIGDSRLWIFIISLLFLSIVNFRFLVKIWGNYRYLLVSKIAFFFSALFLLGSVMAFIVTALTLFYTKPGYTAIIGYTQSLLFFCSLAAFFTLLSIIAVSRATRQVEIRK